MKPRIAISAPMSVPMEHLSEVEDLLNERHGIPYGHISFWDRKSAYDQKQFNQADAVIVILPNFSFDSTKIKREWYVPIGVHRELQIAEKQGKKIFLAYKTTEGVLQFYAANIFIGLGDQHTDTVIKGMAGTSGPNGAFCGWLKSFEGSEIKQDFFIDEKEREEELRKWAEDHRINQAGLEKAAMYLMQNSMYGAFGELDHPSEQVKFPEMRRVYASTIPNSDYSDNRLLLML
jgi:hypothetical protein